MGFIHCGDRWRWPGVLRLLALCLILSTTVVSTLTTTQEPATTTTTTTQAPTTTPIMETTSTSACGPHCVDCDEEMASCSTCEVGYYKDEVEVSTTTTTTISTTTTPTTAAPHADNITSNGTDGTVDKVVYNEESKIYRCKSCDNKHAHCVNCSESQCYACDEGMELDDNTCTNCTESQTLENGICVEQDGDDDGLHVGIIVGIVLGVIVLVVIVVIVIVLLVRRRRNPASSRQARQAPPAKTDLQVAEVGGQENTDVPSEPVYQNMGMSKPSTKDIQQSHEKVTRYTSDPTVHVVNGMDQDVHEDISESPLQETEDPDGDLPIYTNGPDPEPTKRESGHHNQGYSGETQENGPQPEDDDLYENTRVSVLPGPVSSPDADDIYENEEFQRNPGAFEMKPARKYQNVGDWTDGRPVTSTSQPNLNQPSELTVPKRTNAHSAFVQRDDDDSDSPGEEYYNVTKLPDTGGESNYVNPRLHHAS